MRIPQQVSERVKEAPAQALRAVFSGIGQVLLVADRIKSRATDPQRGAAPHPSPRPAPRPRPQPGPAPTAKEEGRWRSLDETGNVRLLSQEERAAAADAALEQEEVAGPEVVAEPGVVAEPEDLAGPEEVAEPEDLAEPEAGLEPAPPAEPEATAEPEPAAEPEAVAAAEPEPAPEPAQTALPVPNYDELSVASLRARLRNLDPSQVRALLDYEKAHAGRAPVVTMFERRIAKLESGEA
jgi:hypothetical protein